MRGLCVSESHIPIALCASNHNSHIKTKLGIDGTRCVRYTSFISQLKRIASQHRLQLNPVTSTTSDPVNHRQTSAWRLSLTDCFAVQISHHKSIPSANEYEASFVVDNTTTIASEEWVTIVAVHFEYNYDKVLIPSEFHYCSLPLQPCPELVTELNAGKFHSLSEHMGNLVTVYAVPGNKTDRARSFMCLEAMEQDLYMLSQVAQYNDTDPMGGLSASFAALKQKLVSTSNDPNLLRAFVNQSMVGNFVSRSGGRLAQLTYLVTPAQAAMFRAQLPNTDSPSMTVQTPRSVSTMGRGSVDGLVGGYLARLGLRPRPTESEVANAPRLQQLAFMPLVTLQEDAHGNRVPDFAQPDDIKCLSVEAEFVLYLDPPVPLCLEAVKELEAITNLSYRELVANADLGPQNLVLLILQRHEQGHLYGINTHLRLPNRTQHSYAVQSSVEGYLIERIPFTCSNQLGRIITLLRLGASFATFLETFVVHPRRPIEKVDLNVGPFAVERALVNATFPNVEPDGSHIRLETGAECQDPTQADPITVLARSHALPVGLAWLLMKFGCPVHLALQSAPLGPSTQIPPSGITDSLGSLDTADRFRRHLTSPRLLNDLRSMLGRARSYVLIQGATGTNGVLSGADRLPALDLCPPLLPAIPDVSRAASNAALKMPPLPPGVMATPPPRVANTEATTISNDLLTDVMTAVRNSDTQTKSRVGNSLSTSNNLQAAFNPRGLRLDDLLIENIFQQRLATPQPPFLQPPEHISQAKPIMTTAGGAMTKMTVTRDHVSDVLPSPPRCLTTPTVSLGGGGSLVSPKLSSTTVTASSGFATQGGRSVAPPNQSLPVCMPSVPGTFASNTLPSMNANSTMGKPSTGYPTTNSTANKSLASNGGSMLVNLLNEEPVLTCNSSMLSQYQNTSSASRLSTVSSLPSIPLLPGVDTYNTSSSLPAPLRAPGPIPATSPPLTNVPPTVSSINNATIPRHSPIPPTNTSTPVTSKHQSLLNSTPNRTTMVMASGMAPTVMATPGLSKSRSSSATVSTPSTTITATVLTPTPVGGSGGITGTKKGRKRRRGNSDGLGPGVNPKCGSLVSSTPHSAVATSVKQSRVVDTVTHSAVSSSVASWHHRGSFNSTSLVVNPIGSPTLSSLGPGLMGVPIPTSSLLMNASGKSVYDFDDTPSSVFDNPNTSSITSPYPGGHPSGSSTSKISSNSSGYSASGSSMLGVSAGALPTSAPFTLGSSLSERTVERKSSLKVTIKALPPAQLTGMTSKSGPGKSDVPPPRPPLISEVRTKGPSLSMGQPAVKKRKRRSVDGKPSSYLMQMHQHTGANLVHSSTHSATANLVKASKGPIPMGSTTAVNHATLIVKKERKRRANHSSSEKVKPLSLITNTLNSTTKTMMGSVTGTSTTSLLSTTPSEVATVYMDRSKPIDTTQLSRIPPSPVTTSQAPLTPNKAAVTTTGSVKKKLITDNPPSASSSASSSSSSANTATTDDHILGKRLGVSASVGSTTLQTTEHKRKKHGHGNHPPSGTSQYDMDDDTGNNTSHASNSDPAAGAKLVRSSTQPSARASSLTPVKKSHSKQLFPSASMSSGLSTAGTTSGSLIKGYKIPKKKSTTQLERTTPTVSESTSNSASNILISQLVTNNKTLETVVTDTTAVCNSNRPPTEAIATTSSLESTSSITSQALPKIQPTVMDPNLPSVGSQPSVTGQPQTTPRRLPNKSISDIVDKLRAKSSGSGIAAFTSTTTTATAGASVATVSSVPQMSQPTSQLASTDGTNPAEEGTPAERDTSSDSHRDNIFDKFSTGTPNPSNSGEMGRSGASQSAGASPSNGTNDPTPSSPSVDEATVEGVSRVQNSTTDLVKRTSPSASGSGDCSSRDTTDGEDGAKRDAQYEVIMAQTDTPASPTESSSATTKTASRSTAVASSKIIPISPTSANRKGPGNNSRAPTTSGKERFPRPPTSTSISRGGANVEGFIRSGGALLGNRPRGMSHGMHQSKAGNNFKGPQPNWSCSGPTGFPEVGGVGGPSGTPWMVAPTLTGPSFANTHPTMPFHSGGGSSSVRPPMRPPGQFDPTGGNMFGGGPMRGGKR